MPDQKKRPELQCDLVMKGGITSGIVYPPALSELAAKYIFNSIGGTSAGAIAAASAAAAEYRRWATGTNVGFDELLATASWLGGKKRLFRLFKAPKGTRPIMSMIDASGGFGGFGSSNVPGFLRPAATVGKVLWALMRVSPWRFFTFGLLVAFLLAFPMGGEVTGFVNSVFDALPDGLVEFLGAQPTWIVVGLLALVVALMSTLARKSKETGWSAVRATVVRFVGALVVTSLIGAIILLLVAPFFSWLRDLINPALRAIGLAGIGRPNPSEGPVHEITVLLMTLFFLAGAIIANIYHLIAGVLLKAVPKNFYGIVNGHDQEESDKAGRSKADPNRDDHQPPAKPNKPTMLTDWLSVQLDKVAGLSDSGPLTFGQLCDAGITLKMISTNISHGLPYELPFKDQSDCFFIFSEAEMLRLFPAYVVHHLVTHRHEPGEQRAAKLPKGYYYLPEGRDLPVILAVRMSLAVPIFISAVPLYTLRASALRADDTAQGNSNISPEQSGEQQQEVKEKDLQVNFFSDGGTASNFPIHFFDGWLPTRPTFGINLTALPEEAIYEATSKEDGPPGTLNFDYVSMMQSVPSEPVPGDGLEDADAEALAEEIQAPVPTTFLPNRRQRRPQTWRPVSNPLDFIMKVIDTARENHDNLQSRLPGYSGRIIDIYLKDNEGGMNLAMSTDTIDAVMSKGREAGKTLRCDFDFEHHRWVRFLSLMSNLEVQLFSVRDAYRRTKLDYKNLIAPNLVPGPISGATTSIEDTNLTPGQEGPYVPFVRDDKWRAEALTRLETLVHISEQWHKPGRPIKMTDPDPQPVPSPLIDGTVDWSSVERRELDKCDKMMTTLEPDERFFHHPKLKPESALRVTPELSG